ncbi:MAG: hypothetical protein R6W31_20250, partial [Bacteroidales bacterium]
MDQFLGFPGLTKHQDSVTKVRFMRVRKTLIKPLLMQYNANSFYCFNLGYSPSKHLAMKKLLLLTAIIVHMGIESVSLQA